MPFIVKYDILLLLLHIQVCLWEFVCKWLLRAGNMREIFYYTIINWLTILYQSEEHVLMPATYKRS